MRARTGCASLSLEWSASNVSPQVLSLLVLYPNIPDEPPKACFSCGVSVSGVCWGLRVAGLLSRGFLFIGSPTHALRHSLFGHTLSERRVGGWGVGVGGCYSTPHGFAYCDSSSERWVGSPMGQYLSSHPSSVITWDCASPLTPARLSRAPRPDCDLPLRPLPGVSPSRRKACLSR